MALPLEAAATFADDFKWRFLTCAALSVPIAYLAEPIQRLLGLGVDKRLERADEIVLALAACVVLYGGWPFLAGTVRELLRARPGSMMVALIAIGASSTFATATILITSEVPPLWQTVALVDALLFGNWLALAGASRTERRTHQAVKATVN